MSRLWSAKLRDDPEAFVMFVFPWGEKGTPLEKRSGPRKWQREILRKIKAHIEANGTRDMYEVFRLAVASGRGIGKSALVSWLVLWMLSTRIGASVIVSANSEAQLRSVTWAEITKWLAMLMNSHWFEISATRIVPAKWLTELVERDLKKGTRYWGAEGEDGVGDVEGPGEAEADVEKAGDFEGEGVAEEGEKMGGLEVGEEADDAEAEHDEDGVEGNEVGSEGDPDAGFVGLDIAALGGEAEFVDFAAGGEGDEGVGEFVAEDVESDGAEAGDEVGEDPSDESEAEEAKFFGLPDAVAGDEPPAHFNEGEDGDESDGSEEEDADPFFEAEGLALGHADGVAGDVESFAPGAALRAGRGGLASVFFRGQQHGLSLFNFF